MCVCVCVCVCVLKWGEYGDIAYKLVPLVGIMQISKMLENCSKSKVNWMIGRHESMETYIKICNILLSY